MEGEAFQIFWLNVVDVLFILVTQYNICDTSTLCSQNFLLDTSHRKHLATQCDFARHSQFAAHFPFGECGNQ